jgi:hypothetical protein
VSSATYVAADQFKVDGDLRPKLGEGQRVYLTQGVDGTAEGAISAVSYASDETTITLTTSIVTTNIEDAKAAPGYSDPSDSSGNIALHEHKADYSGKLIPATSLTQDIIDVVSKFPLTPAANEIVGWNSGAVDLELKIVEGTTNQITVSFSAGTITLSLPQNINTGASPTFAGMILSGLTGVLIGNGGSALSDGGSLSDLADVDDDLATGIQDNDIMRYVSSSGEWEKIDIGTLLALLWQGSWALSTSYTKGQLVENDGAAYICTDDHTSSASDEPGTGAYWADYWDIFCGS